MSTGNMATPSEKLAESLTVLKQLQEDGNVAIRSTNLARTHRERLLKNGFLQEIMKGWYITTNPSERAGDSTAWYTSFWSFCSSYLQERFGENWCLSPEQSLLLHVANRTVPKQLLVRSDKAHNSVIQLPYATSILEICANQPDPHIIVQDGLRIYSIQYALISCPASFYQQNPTDVRAALTMIRDASEILELLIEGSHTTIAGRLAGAFRNIGQERIADDIITTMRSIGYDVREQDPFEKKTPSLILNTAEHSPYVNRLKLMWQEMREPIIEIFPKSLGLTQNIDTYLQDIEANYTTDAYHSLSIEGYKVSPELITKVHTGNWNPGKEDKQDYNALAARGYWQAYRSVRESLIAVLNGENSGDVAGRDHRNWYREMFLPSVTAGIIKPIDLAGYRSAPVYIRQSMHVPPAKSIIRELLPAFFDLLRTETEASVRIVLGHFLFVYIHPYMDGNGRIGRFLMNVMCASGGYPWLTVPVEKRDLYMNTLEKASTSSDIKPFAHFIGSLVEGKSG